MGKIRVRRVGNSLGVIIPQATLQAWGVGDGDELLLTPDGIRPARHEAVQQRLDEIKRKLAVAVLAQFTANHIRAHSLANLHRWKCAGVWVSAYDEWQQILQSSDGELFATLLGRDERSERLRQSPPYVGLLPREVVRNIIQEAGLSSKRSHAHVVAEVERDFG